MNCIKVWQVNVDGLSSGNVLSSGFRPMVDEAHIVKKTDKWILIMHTITYRDSTYAEAVYNDDLKHRVEIDLGTDAPTDNIQTLVANEINNILNAAHGASNVDEDPV